jgi:uncharacterized protein
VVRKITVLMPVIVAAIIIGSAGLVFIPSNIKNTSVKFHEGKVRINSDEIKVEIAKTAAEKQRWLMFREEKLPFNSAMMLIYEKPDLYSIWLINIQYNLDLVWFDENGHVVYIAKDKSPCKNLFDVAGCTYKNTKPAKYIISATSGFIDVHKITFGSKLEILSL